MFFGTLVLALGVTFGIYSLRPGLLGLGEPGKAVSQQAAADSTHASPAAQDARRAPAAGAATVKAADSLKNAARTAPLRDSLSLLATQLQQERKRADDEHTKVDELSKLVAVAETARTGVDSAKIKERKSFAKVMESMEAESAARILKGLPDTDVKEILGSVKKRQAAKILSYIDPERAARIIR